MASCIFCGKGVSIFSGRIIFKDGAACASCLNSAGIGRVVNAEMKTAKEVRDMYNRGKELMKIFSPTMDITGYAQFDDVHKLLLIDKTIVEYSHVISYSITDNSNVRTCSKLGITVSIKETFNSSLRIDFIRNETKVNSIIYNGAKIFFDDCVAKLSEIVDGNKNVTTTSGGHCSAADELLKYKNLLDIGAITQEEFDAKKKQLLGF